MFEYDLNNPDYDEAVEYLRSFPRDTPRTPDELKRRDLDLSEVRNCIAYWEDDPGPQSSWEQSHLERTIASIDEIHTELLRVKRSAWMQELAEQDARRLFLPGVDTRDREDDVLFATEMEPLLDPSIRVLIARSLPHTLSARTDSTGKTVHRAKRWVYDVVADRVEESNWCGTKAVSAAVPLPAEPTHELFQSLLGLLEIDDAYEATLALHS